MGERILNGLAWVVAFVCVAPIAAAALAALAGDLDTWRGLVATVLPGYVLNTLMLVALVAIGTAAIGTGAAWLVTMYRFPGARLLEVLLVLPLAFPAYVLAYAYTDFLAHPGPVQTLLREVTGWGPRDYWFPNIRSLPGAALMLICVYYPYVYLLARTAFGQQAATAYLAARTLGQGPWGAFLRVSLPMARPAIAAGVLLAVMETIADYGTVVVLQRQDVLDRHLPGMVRHAGPRRARRSSRSACWASRCCWRPRSGCSAARRGATARRAAGRDRAAAARRRPAGWSRASSASCRLGRVPAAGGRSSAHMAAGSGQSLADPRYLRFVVQLADAGRARRRLVTVVGAVLVGYRARLVPGRASRGWCWARASATRCRAG